MIGSVVAPSTCTRVSFAHFLADGKQPKEEKLKSAHRGEVRATEEDWRTMVLIPSGAIAKADSRMDRTLFTFLGEKNTQRRVDNGYSGMGWVQEIWRQTLS